MWDDRLDSPVVTQERAMKVLVLGTVLRPAAFAYNAAANPASTKWLSGFLCGLQDCDVVVSLCGHCYAQAWPKGPLLPGKEEYLDNRYENHLVRFINVPGLRFRSMGRGYYQVASKLAHENKYDAIVTYNPYPWHVAAARKLRATFGIPWICLNLDFDDVGVNWEKFLGLASDADGHLFLSHWGYENAPVERKIHLDSGVSVIPESFGGSGETDPLTIVYLGKLSSSGGLEILLKLPALISEQNIRFIYGGKGYPDADAKLKALAQRDARVEYQGFVEETQVSGLFERAAIFLNPRDPDEVVNDMVFPSKIMEYLKYGKTVVSTWTKGLNPIYRDLMLISESPSAIDFSTAVKTAIQETTNQRADRAKRIRAFLEYSRLWSKQAERFVTFTEEVVEDFHSKIKSDNPSKYHPHRPFHG